jgi:sugar-specific transcriptional regulator TrmB
MSKVNENLLLELGLSKEEVSVYLYILKSKPQTAAKIRKKFGFGADKVTNILDNLIELTLITLITEDHNKYYVAQPTANIEKVLEKQKKQMNEMSDRLPDLYEELDKYKKNAPLNSKVVEYHGLDGFKQVMWNSTKAKDDIRLFVYSPNGKYLDFNFYDEIRKVYVEREIFSYELFNGTEYDDFTEVKEFLKFYDVRHISPELMEFHHEILVYNDVTAIYKMDSGKTFCMEIYNKKLANMQKQIFDFVWKRAEPLKIISDGGAMVKGD